MQKLHYRIIAMKTISNRHKSMIHNNSLVCFGDTQHRQRRVKGDQKMAQQKTYRYSTVRKAQSKSKIIM